MLTSKISTIQEHLEITGNRFELAQVIMRRTKELMAGAPIKKGVQTEFKSNRHQAIPNQQFIKVALEELRTGKLKWKHTLAPVPTPSVSEIIDVEPPVFGTE